MSHIDLELPEAIHQHVKQSAEKGGICVNQLISSAIQEKHSALEADPYFKARAKRANRNAYEILAHAPTRQPLTGDELPEPK